MRKIIGFFGLITVTCLVLWFCGWFNTPQLLSIAIFSTFIYGTLMFGEFRLAFAFGGISLLLAMSLMDIPQFVQSANLKVIIFLVGMFLVIGFLEENRFFEYIVGVIVRAVGPRPKTLLLVLMIMATISAALVDEVTSILFMTGTMLSLTSKYKLNPVPFIIMLVFATNVGSAASSIGNPIGVMIALNAGFSFIEFLRWSAPIALVVNIVTYFVCRWWFADAFRAFARAIHVESGAVRADEPQRGESEAPVWPGWVSWLVFLVTIALLVMHGPSERLLGQLTGTVRETLLLVSAPDGRQTVVHHQAVPDLKTADGRDLRRIPDEQKIGLELADGSVVKHLEYGLREGTMMLGAALSMGCVVLLIRGPKARDLVERRVDWWTLSFFMMLFASVGTLEHMGVTEILAAKLIAATGGNESLLIWVVGWTTGWLSAFLDNVLAVATFMPVVHDIRVAHAVAHPHSPMFSSGIYWAMLFGGTFMGNMTVIGSTANIIAIGVLEKRGHGVIRFSQWFKIGVIVSIVSMLLACALLTLLDWTIGVPMMPPPTQR